jgi:predicted dehydrogenase
MGFHLRHHRLVLQARDGLRSGLLGQVQACRAAWCAPRPLDQSDWKNRRALGGGALVELAVHYYDLLRFLLEEDLEPVQGRALSAERDDEAACVLGQTTGGIPFSGLFSERASHQLEFEFYGSRGRLKLDCLRFDGLRFTAWGVDTGAVAFRARELWQTLLGLPEGLRSFRSGGDYLGSYREQWRHFADVVTGQTSPLCRVEDGVAALEAVQSSL